MVKDIRPPIGRGHNGKKSDDLSSLSHAILQSTGAAIYIVQNGKFVYASPLTLEFSGYSEKQMKAKYCLDLVYPDDRENVRSKAIESLKSPSTSHPYEYRFVRKDGAAIWVMERVTPIEYNEARAVMGSFMDISEKKMFEDACLKSEERYRDILGQMQDGYFEVDLAGNFTFVNDAACRVLGRSHDELLKINFVTLTDPASIKAVFKAYHRVFETGEPMKAFSNKIVHKDGSVRYAEQSIAVRKDEKGNAVGFRCVGRDVTKRKEMEEALSRSEERFRTIIEQMQDSYYELDLKGHYTFANPALCRIFGYSMEELAGKDYRSLVPEDEIKRLFNAYNEVYKTGQPNTAFIHKSRRKDETIVFLESAIDLLRNKEGKPAGFRTVSRDISARKLLEDELRQSEERYRAILEEMEDAYYEVAIGGDFTFVNDQTCRDTGYTRKELIGMSFRKLTPPGEHKGIYDAYLKVFTTGGSNKGYAHRIIRKDGSILFVEAAVSLLKDKQGQIIGFRSVSRDVTERKQLEDALANSEERYRTILEQLQDSYYEVDLAGNILFANEATCRNLGTTMEKLVGSNYQGMIPDDEKATFDATFSQVYDTGVPNKGFAHRIIMPDGSVGYTEASISPLRDKSGQIIGFRCVSRDVTERKQMEQLLADMATHDFLTELPNRVLLIDRFEVAIAQAQRKHYKLAIMSLDLDRFKEVNDTLGHSAGDEVLKHVARKLTSLVRSSDTVARLGGDEFLLLLQEIQNLDDAIAIAEKIVGSFKDPFTSAGRQLYLSSSIGIAMYPDDGNDLETLMKKSDASMYYSKRRGGSQYKVNSTGEH